MLRLEYFITDCESGESLIKYEDCGKCYKIYDTGKAYELYQDGEYHSTFRTLSGAIKRIEQLHNA